MKTKTKPQIETVSKGGEMRLSISTNVVNFSHRTALKMDLRPKETLVFGVDKTNSEIVLVRKPEEKSLGYVLNSATKNENLRSVNCANGVLLKKGVKKGRYKFVEKVEIEQVTWFKFIYSPRQNKVSKEKSKEAVAA